MALAMTALHRQKDKRLLQFAPQKAPFSETVAQLPAVRYAHPLQVLLQALSRSLLVIIVSALNLYVRPSTIVIGIKMQKTTKNSERIYEKWKFFIFL